jgi:hypothetical protein
MIAFNITCQLESAGMPNIVLGDTCYWLNTSGAWVTYDQAEMTCRTHGGDLAHLLSNDVIMPIAQRMMLNSTSGVGAAEKQILEIYLYIF